MLKIVFWAATVIIFLFEGVLPALTGILAASYCAYHKLLEQVRMQNG